MSDGRAKHAGLLRTSMKALVEQLQNDAFLIENDVEVRYRLDHPSKQIDSNIHKFRLTIEPAGFSQTTGAGVLDVQYFTWIIITCKPHSLGEDEEDNLTYICEYLTDLLHRSTVGELATYVSRTLLNFKSCEISANHRSTQIKLADDEIGSVVWVWQTPKTIQQVDEDGTGEYEAPSTMKLETE